MKIIRTDVYPRKTNVFRLNRRSAAVSAVSDASAPNRDVLAGSRAAESGFTLAEIMVGCVLLAMMVISLYGGISFGFASINMARQNLRATQIALEKMEITRMYSWEQLNSNGFVPRNFTAPFYPSADGIDTNGGLTYYGTTIITNVNRHPAYSNEMREMRVFLSWTNKNIPQSLEMSTYLSEYGMQRYIY
jgi:hypothetical protein